MFRYAAAKEEVINEIINLKAEKKARQIKTLCISVAAGALLALFGVALLSQHYLRSVIVQVSELSTELYAVKQEQARRSAAVSFASQEMLKK